MSDLTARLEAYAERLGQVPFISKESDHTIAEFIAHLERTPVQSEARLGYAARLALIMVFDLLTDNARLRSAIAALDLRTRPASLSASLRPAPESAPGGTSSIDPAVHIADSTGAPRGGNTEGALFPAAGAGVESQPSSAPVVRSVGAQGGSDLTLPIDEARTLARWAQEAVRELRHGLLGPVDPQAITQAEKLAAEICRLAGVEAQSVISEDTAVS